MTIPGTALPLLVGREREQAMLRDHLAAALAGRGSLVLIGGEAGIGKTALAETVSREAVKQDAVVLVGRCYDLTETPPYGPWVELFGRYQPTDGDPPLPAAFAQRGTLGEITSQAMLFQQVQDFLTTLARQRPLVLLLDDLHWADPASLDLLRFLARSLTRLPLLLLVTYRSDELTRRHPLYALLPTLVRESHAERLDLRPLTENDVRELLANRYRLGLTDTVQLIAYLHERTGGNPFFLGELLRTLEEEGTLHATGGGWTLGDLTRIRVPPLLRQVIDGRLTRLGEEAQILLGVAAVIGQEVPLTLWSTVAGIDDETLVPIIERAVEAHLLTETPDGTQMRFVHALIREALYEGMLTTRRRMQHRQIGDTLAVLPDANLDAVAYHFQQAGDARAVVWLIRAGGRAQAAFAWTTAAQRFEVALSLMEQQGADAGERGWLLLRLARLLRYVEIPKARAFVEKAVALAEAVNDGALFASAQFHRGCLACAAGDVAYGLPEMERGADALATLSEAERAQYAARAVAIGLSARMPDGQRKVAAWRTYVGRGTVVTWRAYVGRYREARVLGERLVAETVGGDEAAMQSIRDGHNGLGESYAMLGMPNKAATMYAIAHDTYLRSGHHAHTATVLWRELGLVALSYWTEDIAGRRRLAERAEAEWTRASGAVPATIPPRFMRLSLLVLEGHWEEAEQLTLVGSAEVRGSIVFQATALIYLAALAKLRGDSERAWLVVREWLPAASMTEPGAVVTFDVATALQQVAASLALDEDDLPSAKEWLEAHDRWLAWSGAVLGQSEGQALWAQFHRQSGDAESAREHAERALAHATAPRQPLALLAAHRLLGELDTDADRYADAQIHLDAALALADACQAPYERALTLLAMAERHAATNQRAEALALLDEVRTICTPLGAKPALARADALIAQLTPYVAPRYPAGLTEREVEILRLVAAGHTNRQIADMLSLSPRTIDVHVRNIFAKTGTENRAGATAFAFRHTLA